MYYIIQYHGLKIVCFIELFTFLTLLNYNKDAAPRPKNSMKIWCLASANSSPTTHTTRCRELEQGLSLLSHKISFWLVPCKACYLEEIERSTWVDFSLCRMSLLLYSIRISQNSQLG